MIELDLDILKNGQFIRQGGTARSYGETVERNHNLKEN